MLRKSSREREGGRKTGEKRVERKKKNFWNLVSGQNVSHTHIIFF